MSCRVDGSLSVLGDQRHTVQLDRTGSRYNMPEAYMVGSDLILLDTLKLLFHNAQLCGNSRLRDARADTRFRAAYMRIKWPRHTPTR